MTMQCRQHRSTSGCTTSVTAQVTPPTQAVSPTVAHTQNKKRQLSNWNEDYCSFSPKAAFNKQAVLGIETKAISPFS